jgi:Helix-turn-helix domain
VKRTAPDDPWLTTKQVADRYPHTSESTVRYWRHMGTGPRGVKIGRKVLYRLSAVLAWEHQREAS